MHGDPNFCWGSFPILSHSKYKIWEREHEFQNLNGVTCDFWRWFNTSLAELFRINGTCELTAACVHVLTWMCVYTFLSVSLNACLSLFRFSFWFSSCEFFLFNCFCCSSSCAAKCCRTTSLSVTLCWNRVSQWDYIMYEWRHQKSLHFRLMRCP